MITSKEEAIVVCDKAINLYRGENGYPCDQRQAIALFKEIEPFHISSAMNYLGIVYENGVCVAKDIKAAEYYYKMALKAEPTEPYASFNLGRGYMSGLYGNIDYNLALNLFKVTIAELKPVKNPVYYQAIHFSGNCLIQAGKKLESFKYFKEAAFDGNIIESWHNLGYLAEIGVLDNLLGVTGIGSTKVASRYAKAEKFYLKSANQGFVDSMLRLANIYSYVGFKDCRTQWLEKAAAKGDKRAKTALKLEYFADLL